MRQFLIILFCSVLVLSCTETKKTDSAKTGQGSSAEATGIQDNRSRKLPGLMFVDVYLNMEEQGFKTTKTFSADYGNLWECKYDDQGISYSVSVFGKDASTVESVTATATIQDVLNKSILTTKPFFVFVSSLPYDGSNPEQIAQWIDQNFDNDKSTLTVSEVSFTIHAPTKFTRILSIESSNKRRGVRALVSTLTG